MKILIDILHPAEYNFFRNAITLMEKNSDVDCTIDVTIRSRGKLANILNDEYGANKYRSIGRHYKSLLGKFYGLIVRNIQLLKYCNGKKYDLYVGFGNFYPGFISKFYNKPSVIFQDDCEYKLVYSLCKYSTDYLVVPNSIKCEKNTFHYSGFKELAYLHPKYFSASASILNIYNLSPNQYVFVRETNLNSLNYKGLNPIKLEYVIEVISNFGLTAVVSLETNREISHIENCIVINKSCDVFSLMHFASFTVSYGDSMARESCLLGTPSIYIGKRNMSVNQEFIDKNCMFKVDHITDFKQVAKHIVENNIKQKTEEIIDISIQYEWEDTTEVILNFLKNVYKGNASMLEKYKCGNENRKNILK